MDLLQVLLVLGALNSAPDQDYAWRVHAALDAWTGKVDTKASIALAIESAIVGFALSQSDEGKALAGLEEASRTWFHIGLGLLVVSIACALWVVFPRLRRGKANDEKEWRQNTIYFGHLRHWDPKELASTLGEGKLPQEEQLAQQLVTMSQIAWSKHAWLQGSLVALALGACCLLGVAAFA